MKYVIVNESEFAASEDFAGFWHSLDGWTTLAGASRYEKDKLPLNRPMGLSYLVTEADAQAMLVGAPLKEYLLTIVNGCVTNQVEVKATSVATAMCVYLGPKGQVSQVVEKSRQLSIEPRFLGDLLSAAVTMERLVENNVFNGLQTAGDPVDSAQVTGLLLTSAAAYFTKEQMWESRFSDGKVADVNMTDVLPPYEDASTVPAWAWIEENSSFTGRSNGEHGVFEFMLNLSRDFKNVPDELASVIADARLRGCQYMVCHQGT